MCQAQQAPTQEQKANTELPEWAKPYAKDILSKGQALTDVNQNPYQQYTQPRIAGFSPMQQQAMQGAQSMTPTAQTGAATGAAATAGLGGMGVAGQANPSGFQSQVGGYMNPYMSQILAPQMAETNRQYDIGATKQQSAATQAGAFGGSREAIMAAENERNRNTGLSQVYGQGMNTAYNQAQNQYNQNNQTQLAGYGLANQAAANLGQLGQNQFGQQMGINQLQNQYGTSQQNLAQTGLNTAYQDFQNEKNYPYKQLGFMSDMVRGLPLGQQSTSQMYQGPPTALQTVGALGMGAYGLSKMAANGGIMESYADGGDVRAYAGDQGSVTSSGNIEAIIGRLNPQQLQQAKQSALARRDTQTVDAIDARLMELASDKSMTQGIAGAMPQQMADGVVSAAGGGILAFGRGGGAAAEDDDETAATTAEQDNDSGVTPPHLLSRADARIAAMSNFKPTQRTAAEREADVRARYALEKGLAGPDTAGEQYAKTLAEADAARPQALSEGKGLAALAAMQGMVQGNSLVRGIGQAGGAFAQAYAPALQADRKEKLALGNMQFNLVDAQRKERMGMTKSALNASAEGDKSQHESDRARFAQLKAVADASVNNARAGRAPSKSGAGGAPKPFEVLRIANLNYAKYPTEENRQIAEAAQSAAQSLYSGTSGAAVKSYKDASDAFKDIQFTGEWKKHVASNYGKGAEASLNARKDWMEDFRNGNTSALQKPTSAKPAPSVKASPKVIKLD